MSRIVSNAEHVKAIQEVYQSVIKFLELRGWIVEPSPVIGGPIWFTNPYEDGSLRFEDALAEELKHSRDQEYEVLLSLHNS
jgi:hypothetical protein